MVNKQKATPTTVKFWRCLCPTNGMYLPPMINTQQDYFTMIKPEKTTFGQHLEYGLTNLGKSIYESVKAQQDGELLDIKLGLMRDEEKLRFLKQDLYQAARARGNAEHLVNLKNAIATIEESIERKHRRDTEPVATINSFICTLFWMSFLLGCFSFPVTAVCQNYHSLFCNNSRAISNAVWNYFQEPKQ